MEAVVNSTDGAFWSDDDSILGPSRVGLEVLDQLSAHGLGHGGGYRIMEDRVPGRGTDYTFLALLTHRGRVFIPCTAMVLKRLHKPIRDAICRIRLPLVPTTPILRQIMDDDEQGYICLDSAGCLLEVNRRAHDIASRYRGEIGLHHRSRLLQDLATRLLGASGSVHRAIRKDGREVLEIRRHRLAKETHALSEDVTLMVLRTVEVPESSHLFCGEDSISGLTPMEARIAKHLTSTGDSRKQIASKLKITEGTIRTHMQNLYRKLGVQSRAELTAMNRPRRT